MYLASYSVLAFLPAMLCLENRCRVEPVGHDGGADLVHQLSIHRHRRAWSWLAELVPPRIRGRYFSRRQICQLAVLIRRSGGVGFCRPLD